MDMQDKYNSGEELKLQPWCFLTLRVGAGNFKPTRSHHCLQKCLQTSRPCSLCKSPSRAVCSCISEDYGARFCMNDAIIYMYTSQWLHRTVNNCNCFAVAKFGKQQYTSSYRPCSSRLLLCVMMHKDVVYAVCLPLYMRIKRIAHDVPGSVSLTFACGWAGIFMATRSRHCLQACLQTLRP